MSTSSTVKFSSDLMAIGFAACITVSDNQYTGSLGELQWKKASSTYTVSMEREHGPARSDQIRESAISKI